MYEGLQAETVSIAGDGGDLILAYFARPLGPGPFPGVVVIHHMPGWDQETKEIARTFAVMGYSAIAPNLHHRDAPGAGSGDAAAASRAAGGVPDDRCVGDIDGAVRFLRALPTATGKVGVIGYCSGGRQTYIVACRLPIDAAIDCYGGRVVMEPESLNPRQPVAPIDMTADLQCPLLGLFGVLDSNPDPAQVATMHQALEAHDKTFEFHSYPDAGHAFFSPRRPSYQHEAARDGWKQVSTWFRRHLADDAS